MRLRLTLLRPSLPAIKALWPLPTGSQTLTISALLTLLSATFPLDSPTLGLETYSLSISGYEALHWQEVGSVLKDEDEVVVRAISGNEVRARRLGGREGVTEHGRRVLDGVAWGRGKGRAEGVVVKKGRDEEDVENDDDDEDEEWEGESDSRESKRVRFTVADGETPGEEEEWMQRRLIEGPLLGGHRTLVPFGGEEDSEDDEDDEDFEGFEIEESEGSDAESDEAVDGEEDSSSETSTDSDDSSGEEEDDSSDSSSSDSSSESSDESVEDTSTDKRNHITAEPTPTPATGKSTRPGATKTQQLTNGIFSLIPNEMATTTTPVGGALTNGKATNIPYEGLPATKARNVRRRDAKKLKYLKAAEVLPADATLADLQERKKGDPRGNPRFKDQTTEGNNQPAKEVNCGDDMSEVAGAPTMSTAKRASEADSETMARKRRRLLDAIESGGIEITTKERTGSRDEDDEEPDEVSSKIVDASMSNGHSTAPELNAAEDTLDANGGTAEPQPRRARLDLAGSQRHIFASLGVRAPKSDQQKEALRKKLASRRGPAAKAAIAAIAASEAVDTEPEVPATAPESEHATAESEPAYHWSDRIDLRAVECVDENVTLSTPPYPFHQRWDSQYHKRKNRNKASYMSGGKGQRQTQSHVETYDKYFPDQDGDYLDYGDDDGAEWEEGEYWDDNALLGDDDPSALQLQAEANATVALETDLPALPEDISTLPLLPEADAAVGDIVTYTELVCEAATSWQPKMLARTAELIEHDVERNEWGVRMAIRDMPQRTFDEEGNRVYAKFEMEGEDAEGDEEVDERARVLSWGEMGEVRLLRKGEM
nr:hypothetical protein B0A51_16303 [Rachicladosporium sp. CCFEE 5018]